MTAHKNFKKLVRARMAKTGEAYTTARRHVIHAGHRVDGPPAARSHLPGSVPATAALRVLLTHAGVRGPDGEPLSEAMAFGIAGGVGIGVFQFYYEKDDFASFFLAGRHYWHDDLPYAVNTFQELELEPAVKETAGATAAEKHLREALAGERPCMLWVDAANLSYLGLPAAFSGGGYHVITAYGVDDDEGVAWVGDCTDTPLKVPLEDLARARARIVAPDFVFEESEDGTTLLFEVLTLAFALVGAFAGGYVAQAISGRNPRPVVALATLVFLLGTAIAIAQLNLEPPEEKTPQEIATMSVEESIERGRQPIWYSFLLPVLGASGVLIGGRARWRSRSGERTSDAAT